MVEALDRQVRQGRHLRLARFRRVTASLCAASAIAGFAAPVGTAPALAEDSPPRIVVGATAGAAPAPPDLPVVDGKVELSLDQALALALERELGLRVQRYTRTQTWYGILQVKGIYDLNLNGVVSTLDNTGAQVSQLTAASFKQQTWNLGLAQLIGPLNSRVRVDFDNTRSESDVVFNALNPSFDSSLRFGYSQPLLRNFGRNPGTRALRVARKNDQSTASQFERSVSNTIQNVDFAYWNLVAARQQLYVSQESLTLARELHSRNKIQVDVGTLAPLELVQSEAAIATRE